MTATRATAELANALASVLADPAGDTVVVLAAGLDPYLRFELGRVEPAGRRVLMLVRPVDRLDDAQRVRVAAAFGRRGRAAGPVAGRLAWVLNLQGRADIAAEAGVGLYAEAFAPPAGDYRVVCYRSGSRGLVTLPDDGRPRRATA